MTYVYAWVTVYYLWGGQPEVTAGPYVFAEQPEYGLQAEPATLHWSPDRGFWFDSSVSGGPVVR